MAPPSVLNESNVFGRKSSLKTNFARSCEATKRSQSPQKISSFALPLCSFNSHPAVRTRVRLNLVVRWLSRLWMLFWSYTKDNVLDWKFYREYIFGLGILGHWRLIRLAIGSWSIFSLESLRMFWQKTFELYIYDLFILISIFVICIL